jgi:hypothetical protein
MVLSGTNMSIISINRIGIKSLFGFVATFGASSGNIGICPNEAEEEVLSVHVDPYPTATEQFSHF